MHFQVVEITLDVVLAPIALYLKIFTEDVNNSASECFENILMFYIHVDSRLFFRSIRPKSKLHNRYCQTSKPGFSKLIRSLFVQQICCCPNLRPV